MICLSIGVFLGFVFFQIAAANPPELAALIVSLAIVVAFLIVDLIGEFRDEREKHISKN